MSRFPLISAVRSADLTGNGIRNDQIALLEPFERLGTDRIALVSTPAQAEQACNALATASAWASTSTPCGSAWRRSRTCSATGARRRVCSNSTWRCGCGTSAVPRSRRLNPDGRPGCALGA